MRWVTVGPADQRGPALSWLAVRVYARQDTAGRCDPDFRHDHDQLVHPGNQDRAASGFDLATAKSVYVALLGVAPQTDGSCYVGFEAEGQHIALVPGGRPQGMTSRAVYWHVPDI